VFQIKCVVFPVDNLWISCVPRQKCCVSNCG